MTDKENNSSVVDPITLSVVWNRLHTINKDMGERIVRAAQGFIMSNARDVGALILDDKGHYVSQLARLMATHFGTAEVAARAILDRYEGHLEPGDCVLANDGHIIRSGHLPDWVFFAPIYWHDELVFYAHCRAHVTDSGGAYSGGYFPRAYDCIAEGLNIPPLKIIKRGWENEELWTLILRNCRNSPAVHADAMLIYGSMMLAEKSVCELIDRYGLDTVKSCCQEMIRLGEEAMRREIRKIPDGVYHAQTAVDWDGTTPNKQVWIRLELTVKEDELIFDFSETDEQVDFINTPLGTTYSNVYWAVFLSVDPTMPHNHGTIQPIKIIAPEGTVLNPTYPHTYGSCAVVAGGETTETCLIALGKAIPERAIAPWGRNMTPNLMGRDSRPEMVIDPRTGVVREYVGHPFCCPSGTGGLKGYDGWEGIGSLPMSSVLLRGSIEKAEIYFPVRWKRVELAPDTEGPGEFTGCTGTYTEMVQETEEGVPAFVMTGNIDGLLSSPLGIAGAPPSLLHEMYIDRAETKKREPLRGIDMVPLYSEDVLITKAVGGAGWGNPLDRDPERVREDVKDEVVSIERARNVYGVVIEPETITVDQDATKKLREELKENPLYRHFELVMDDIRQGKITMQEARDIYGVAVKEDNRGEMILDFVETQQLRPR